MIGFVLTAASIFACGLATSNRLWRDEGLGDAERVVSGAVVGLALWLAANWMLAFTHLFTRPALIAVAMAMAIAAAALRPRLPRPRLSWLIVPLGLWTLFALWKGYVLPPQTHDALAYHLPKAAMIAQAHGYEQFVSPDPRFTSLPANYELLLAGVLVMSKGDALTEWIGTLTFLLFLCATAAMAERWWGDRAHRAATALAVAGAPVVLLHSSADKNDLLLCFLCVVAILWGARWIAHGGRVPMLLCMVSLAIAGGTKPTAAMVLIALAPFLLLRWRALRVRGLALTAAAAIAAFLLLGGIAYLGILHRSGGSAPPGVESAAKYGDWANLWRVPALMLTIPFEPKPNAVWVPWRHEYWYWPHYEIFFSHFGGLMTVLVVLALFGAVRKREPNRERTIATIVTLLAAALMLPIAMRPLGMFAAMPRYIAFILPVIACWSVPPAIELLRAHSMLLAHVFVAAMAAFFAVSAFDVAVSDRFAPLRFVRWAAAHPGTRHIWFHPGRAASVADRYAGPRDTIAVDGGFDAWSYPAFGAGLTRHVILIDGSEVPPEAQWVAIDRSWQRFWMNPNLTDMGKFWNFVMRGKPLPEDLRLFDALRRDPRFALVYYDPRANQAVFRRIR
ncbi:MAG TPA: hypothetical protein VEO74_15330 [Thermoanaerobaculia bacterium]|nr:hypothetical protein [Thermoanaerobaculia bacterium]